VLRLLGTDLDGAEIARELTVSLNTKRFAPDLLAYSSPFVNHHVNHHMW